MWARDIRFLTFGWCLAIACGKSGSEHDARRHQPGSGGASAAAGAASGGSSKGGASGAGSGGTAADGGAGGGAGSPEGGEPGAGAGGAGGDGDCAPAEPVVITSEAELRAFAARRCETLEGSLTVRSPTLRSLDALLPSSTLRLVTGDLVLDQNPVLENVHGLSGLREIGGSFIVTASHLENLDGLETVRSIGRSSDTDALVLGDNPLLANVAALGGLNRWLTSLIVTNNAELGSLAGLDRLATTNNVTIANNASLEEIGGLTELASSENLTVAANPNLLTVSLPNLEEAGSLNVTSNNALGSVSFPLLAQAGTLTIAGNPALNNVGPLSTLVSVDLLVIASNPMLPQCFVDALDARLQACNMSCGGNDTSALCNSKPDAMRYLRLFAVALSPFLVVSACSEDEQHHGGGKSGDGAGEAGDGGAGVGGKGRGGSSGTSGSEAGEAGMAGEPQGGSGGTAAGGAAGKGGAGKGGAGGSAGSETGGTAAVGGEGASSGASGAGMGGEGGDCTTVSIPLRGATFDTDTSAWVAYDDGIGPIRPIIVTADSQGITADTPPNVAHLGGENGDSAGMYQPITIPRGAITLTLTGYRQVKTQEGTTRLDEMAIQLWQDSPSTTGFIGEFLSLGNDNPSDDWVPFTGTVAVDDYAGSTVHLDLWAETDVSLATDFYVDSLILTAAVCE